MYIDAVFCELLLNAHGLYCIYTSWNMVPVVWSDVKCFTELLTQLDKLFHDSLCGMVGFCTPLWFCSAWENKCVLNVPSVTG